MSFTISKRFEFCASHRLEGLPEDHQCSRLHGHNIVVEVTLATFTLNPVGFVMDYGEMRPLKEWLDATFDHRHLNDLVEFNPTAENFARYIYNWCVSQGWPVSEVGWSETPKTWAYYSRRRRA